VLQAPVTNNTKYVQDLVQQVLWYEAFFWVVFSKATVLDPQHTKEACNALSWVGMSFYDTGYANVAETSAGNIASIINSYYTITKNPNPYDVADLLILIWHIHVLVEFRNDMCLIPKLDEKMAKPPTVSDDKWLEVLHALEVRKEQLNQKLREPNSNPLNDDATSLLRELLRKKSHCGP
jgi:hypothetical protein